MALLEVKDLYKSFESLQVLRGISFSLEQGETLSVIGPSGGGKTTLLRCMNFLGLPDSGSISVNGETLFDSGSGKTLSDADIRRNRLHFGLVFQNFNLFPQYTALENVMLAPRLQAKERSDFRANRKAIYAELRAKSEELLARVGLADKLDYYPHQLSGGSVGDFQPMNVNFGIISPLGYRVKGKRNKNAEISARSLAIIEELMKKEVFGCENNS